MREMRLRLLEQLGQLETEQYQNAVATVEVHRRLYILAQVKSWSLPGAGPLRTCSKREGRMQMVTRLMGKLTHTKVELIQGYCLKCKSKQGIKNANQVIMKNGRPRTQGVCVVCNTRMSTMTLAS